MRLPRYIPWRVTSLLYDSHLVLCLCLPLGPAGLGIVALWTVRSFRFSSSSVMLPRSSALTIYCASVLPLLWAGLRIGGLQFVGQSSRLYLRHHPRDGLCVQLCRVIHHLPLGHCVGYGTGSLAAMPRRRLCMCLHYCVGEAQLAAHAACLLPASSAVLAVPSSRMRGLLHGYGAVPYGQS